MLGAKVTIFNIRDAEAFVRSNLPHVILSVDTREDLVAEGLRILTDMSRRYEPGRGGQDPLTSSFSAYATKFLPGKLRDAWHRMEGHTLTTTEAGQRRWSYPGAAASLDAMQDERAEGLDRVTQLQSTDSYDEALVDRVCDALDTFWQMEKAQIRRVLIGMVVGLTDEQMVTEGVAAYLEDVDLCKRIIAASGRYYEREAA